MLKTIITIFLVTIILALSAQDFSFGKITTSDFDKKSYAPDANAIVLQEYGSAQIEFNEIKNDLVLVYYYHTKILINTKDGLEYANFSIPLYKNNKDREQLMNYKGITYSLDADGKILKSELEKANVLTEKTSNDIEVTKIALPNVKEGSIIELRYSTESPYLFNLESWKFQSYIPKIHSEFVTRIPDICRYNVNVKGNLSLSTRTELPYNTKIQISTGEVRGTETTYIAKDIAAFVKEDYMTSPKNFMSRLTFELASFSIPFGPNYNFSRNWSDVRKQLYDSESFGKELNRTSQFKNIIPTIVNEGMTQYEKAYKIYNYIKDQIKWNKSYGLYTDKGIKKALESKNGNTADINLALISALKAANINANPVILATRDHGIPSLFNPNISDYNYVIAHISIDSTNYLLDASDTYTPFGELPQRCINWRGQLLTNNDNQPIDLISRIASKIIYDFNGELLEDGTLEGELQTHRFGYNATSKRITITGFNSIDEYKENIDENTHSYSIKSHDIKNLHDAELTLSEYQNISFKNFAHINNGLMKFIPFIEGRITKNPFNLDERSYPIDLASTIEENFIFNIKLPNGYKVNEKPKNKNITLPDKSARFFYIIKENDDMLNIQVLTSINKALFMPEEYIILKEFFSQIIQNQGLDISVSKL